MVGEHPLASLWLPRVALHSLWKAQSCRIFALACLLGLETQECSGPQVGILNVEKKSRKIKRGQGVPVEFAHNVP